MNEAKLNAKKRKSLSGSSFCGPNRSFPANDCNHVKAGLSLLGRYKGPGSKEKIRACLYRKAKAKGCFKSSKESETVEFEPVVKEILALFKDGKLTEESFFHEMMHFCEMASLSDSIITSIAELTLSNNQEAAAKVLLGNLA